jgi:signal transducing adaptor molecule
MKEANQPKSQQAPASSLYPSMQASSSIAPAASAIQNGHEKKAKALYDFEAAEDNEVTFKAGDVLIITDDSDQHWWKGINNGVEGLFPANFVTKNLQQAVDSSSQSTASSNRAATVRFLSSTLFSSSRATRI